MPIDWLKNKIIVDSLGLYSNNQRHSNETEKILTSSDLILYVSYFNHSFTDNDKAFIEYMKEMNQLNENQTLIHNLQQLLNHFEIQLNQQR